MANLNDWDISATNNGDAAPDGWPEGMNYSDVNNVGRENMAVVARYFKDINGSLATTGAANTYAVTLNAGYSAYFDGMVFSAQVNVANTGASTINVNALGAKAIVNGSGSALVSGDLIAGQVYVFSYDGTDFHLVGALPDTVNRALNGTLGATTPASANVTTLDATGQTTLGAYIDIGGNAPGAAAGRGQIGAGATNGIQILGQGTSYDTHLANRNGAISLAVDANTQNARALANFSVNATTYLKSNVYLLNNSTTSAGTVGFETAANGPQIQYWGSGTANPSDLYFIQGGVTTLALDGPTNKATFVSSVNINNSTAPASGVELQVSGDALIDGNLRAGDGNTLGTSSSPTHTGILLSGATTCAVNFNAASNSGAIVYGASGGGVGADDLAFINFGEIFLNLPTSAGTTGSLWNDGGTVKVA